MKKFVSKIFPFACIAIVFVGYKPNNLSGEKYTDIADSVPEICNILSPLLIDSLMPFGTPLSGSFPDPNRWENYSACHYQFFTANAKPQVAVRLIKWASKSEALDEYKMNLSRHVESWGGPPERIHWVPDSAYFTDNGQEPNKCFDCGLVVLNGLYTIYVSFAGDDNGNRDRKKTVSLYILEMLCARIPGLVPPRTINRQLPKIN
ncbi:MAG: hypothetical protein JNK14_07910 [Chitinophagaceae bacterium]|nr:hypothetical protein [Chitinophagaceae bacterium]